MLHRAIKNGKERHRNTRANHRGRKGWCLWASGMVLGKRVGYRVKKRPAEAHQSNMGKFLPGLFLVKTKGKLERQHTGLLFCYCLSVPWGSREGPRPTNLGVPKSLKGLSLLTLLWACVQKRAGLLVVPGGVSTTVWTNGNCKRRKGGKFQIKGGPE